MNNHLHIVGGDELRQTDEATTELEMERIKSMPKEVGVLLVVAGIGGLLLPGPVGTPFLLVGGVILWPSAFRRLEASFQRRFPKIHRASIRQIARFVRDLEARYPSRPAA